MSLAFRTMSGRSANQIGSALRTSAIASAVSPTAPASVATEKGDSLRRACLGAAAFAAALVAAIIISTVHRELPGRPETAIMAIGMMFAVAIPLPTVVYLLMRRTAADPLRTALLLLLGIVIALSGTYLYVAWTYAKFPADVLIWSESDFVNDIIKFRTRYPLYTIQQNNESFHYGPVAPVLTFLLATLLGKPDSLLVFRAIQIGFTVCAAALSVLCVRRLLAISGRDHVAADPLWTPVWLLLLLLFASNSLTNAYVQNLHNDALAQLVTVGAFAVLVAYAADGAKKWLVAMAVLPAVAFMVKQNLLIWAPLYVTYLLLFDRPRSFRRVLMVAVGAAASASIVIGGAYLLWKDPFVYWMYTVLERHGFSPLRSLQHVFDTWIFVAAGVLGGAALLHRRTTPQLLGCWMVWLVLITNEIVTSGAAWMLNHIGPGSLIAGIWATAALPVLLSGVYNLRSPLTQLEKWSKSAAALAIVVLSFSGFGFIRIPMSPLPDDSSRYISAIEAEFRDMPASTILLDFGSWMYLRDDVVMKDRAVSIGERGYSDSGDFAPMKQRLAARTYRKILVRNLHADDFWYDHPMMPRSTGLKDALLANYREERTIRAVDGWVSGRRAWYGLSDVSVLVPRAD